MTLPAGIRAYLLGAGRGRRAGGPKAWRDHEGKPLLARQLDFLLRLFPPEAVAVSIQADWKPRCAALPGVRWVPVNPDEPPMGAFLSLLRAAPPAGWSFLHHVDMPVWEPGLFETLAGRIPEAERSGASAILPAHQGRRGHPVLLSSEACRSILKLDPAKDRLDLWLKSRKTLTADVPYACVLENWNQ